MIEAHQVVNAKHLPRLKQKRRIDQASPLQILALIVNHDRLNHIDHKVRIMGSELQLRPRQIGQETPAFAHVVPRNNPAADNLLRIPDDHIQI